MKMAVGVVDSLDRGDRARQPARHRPLGGDRDRAPTRPPRRSPKGWTPRCVYVNASTRFTDGFEFGMGAEIGNSTQKLHARGPIGLRELTTFKYVVHGDGQVRLSRGRLELGSGRRGRRSRGRVQPAAHRAPGARAGGGVPAGARRVSCWCRPARRRTSGSSRSRDADVRLEMTRLAAATDALLEASDVETSREGPSFTFRTLELLSDARPGDELVFLMGADVAAGLESWREPAAGAGAGAAGDRRAAGERAGRGGGGARAPGRQRAGRDREDARDRRLLDRDPPAGGGGAADPPPGPRRRSSS